MPTARIVLTEGSDTQPVPGEARFDIIRAMLERGLAVRSASDSEPSPKPVNDDRPTIVLGHFSDECEAIAERDSALTRTRNIAGLSPAQVADLAISEQSAAGNSAALGAWKPWFPVIDYDRCTNCMQCLSFCLFGVYGVDEDKRIQVQNQDHCKTNCPACSRVCPEAAIMFPKYKSGPINGDEVSAEDLNREKMKVDISALLGGDVYSLLRARSEKAQSRFSKERDADKALSERQRCLAKLAQAGDIPLEVLMALPSPEEIAERAQAASAKAEAARASVHPR